MTAAGEGTATAHGPGASPAGADPVLQVRGLKKHFPAGREGLFGPPQYLRAVDGVDLDLWRGELLGVVGESGCGKTTLARTVIRLYEPTEGQIVFQGRDVTRLPETALAPLRRELQMIFQDPYSSLNPRMTVHEIVGEPLRLHLGMRNEREIRERVHHLLQRVGLNPDHATRYPHEFSGGQRQRIGIARALAVEPSVIIADEPISALDVSIQAQVVNLLEQLQVDYGLTYMFIAHDLSMVKHVSHRVVVMYLGKVMEVAPSDTLYDDPYHPYTQALLSAVPIPSPVVESRRERIVLAGDVPSPVNPPQGCRFCTRCPIAEEVCFEEEPPLQEISDGRWAACHFVEKAREMLGA